MSRLAVAAAALASLVSADTAVRPHVVVHKELTAPETDNMLVVAKPFTVVYHVHNMGNAAATDVRIKEDWPEDSFDFVNGTSTKVFETLPAGSVETFSVSLKAKVSGRMNTARASVDYKYRLEEEQEEGADAEKKQDAEEEDNIVDATSFSSSPGVVDIVTEEDYLKQSRKYAQRDTNLTIIGAMALTLLPFAKWFGQQRGN